MQIDSLNTSFSIWSTAWFSPTIIIGGLTILIMVYLHWMNKRKMRPTMSSIEGIFDEYGSRLLFTIISNNPAGSRCGKLYISKKFFKIFFINKTRINYQINEEFLNPQRGETIPKYIIQGQETFVTILDSNILTKDGNYRLTFSTSDGNCSNNYSHLLGRLFQYTSQKNNLNK